MLFRSEKCKQGGDGFGFKDSALCRRADDAPGQSPFQGKDTILRPAVRGCGGSGEAGEAAGSAGGGAFGL